MYAPAAALDTSLGSSADAAISLSAVLDQRQTSSLGDHIIIQKAMSLHT